jgi:ribonuclease HIII
MMDFFVVEPCTSSNGIEIKLKDKKINLKKAAEVLPSIGDSPVVMLTKFEGYSVSIYASGRIMVKGNGSKKIGAKKGSSLAKKLVLLLEKNSVID